MKVWKFLIPLIEIEGDGPVVIAMPAFAELLDVQAQGESAIAIWALVNPGAATVEHRFRVVGTGHTVPDPPGDYLGTVQFFGDTLVLHVFEVTGR